MKFSPSKYQEVYERDSNQSIAVCSSCSMAISTARFAHSKRSLACLRKLKDLVTFCWISNCLSALMNGITGFRHTASFRNSIMIFSHLKVLISSGRSTKRPSTSFSIPSIIWRAVTLSSKQRIRTNLQFFYILKLYITPFVPKFFSFRIR